MKDKKCSTSFFHFPRQIKKMYLFIVSHNHVGMKWGIGDDWLLKTFKHKNTFFFSVILFTVNQIFNVFIICKT